MREIHHTGPWQRLMLAEYVEQRNGVALGDSRSLRNMLARSFGAGVIAGRAVSFDFSHHPWRMRAGVNLTYILVCLALTLLVRNVLAIP